MTPKKLAQHYLRFWSMNSDGTAVLADNAPREFLHFMTSLAPETDRQLVHESLDGLATGKFPTAPDRNGLLGWFATFPSASARCDVVLGGKNPPKTLTEVLKNAYLAEVQHVRAQVSAWLQSQIDLY